MHFLLPHILLIKAQQSDVNEATHMHNKSQKQWWRSSVDSSSTKENYSYDTEIIFLSLCITFSYYNCHFAEIAYTGECHIYKKQLQTTRLLKYQRLLPK